MARAGAGFAIVQTRCVTGNRFDCLRVDGVHKGDQDGVKGMNYINTVVWVTQYGGVATCERISEAFLIPVLEALLQSFPFVILGFHSFDGIYVDGSH